MGAILKVLTILPAIIDLVERLLGPKTGKQKLETVEQMATTALASLEFMTGKDIVDNTAFADGQRQAIEGIVKMLNASVWKK